MLYRISQAVGPSARKGLVVGFNARVHGLGVPRVLDRPTGVYRGQQFGETLAGGNASSFLNQRFTARDATHHGGDKLRCMSLLLALNGPERVA
jgi:hypothetical protein